MQSKAKTVEKYLAELPADRARSDFGHSQNDPRQSA